MPYKPTGRPPGRPKTNWYETLSARVPQDLAEKVRRYASRHRQTLSEVFRDGFTLLLQEDRYAPFKSDTNAMPEITSDTNGTPEIVSDNITTELGIMSDTKNPAESLAEALHRQRLREIVSDMNEIPESVLEMVSGMNSAHPRPLDTIPLGEPVAIVQQSDLPPIDTSKDVLGDLCTHSHDYGTGQSVRRRSDNECRQCLRARDNAYKMRKRQAAGVA